MCLCVLQLCSQAQAPGACTVYILYVCVGMKKAAQPSRTAPGSDLLGTPQAVNPHKRQETIKKKMNSRKHIHASLPLVPSCTSGVC